MSAEQRIRKHADFLSSAVDKAQRDVGGVSDTEASEVVYMLSSLVHHHDGSMGQIVWNDVQAIMAKNRYLRKGRGGLLPVPASATEGYNKHRHTSEFDGGVIPGAVGIHNHSDNNNSGFAFAVLHPSTSLPHAVWEG